jgi:hypothetical protein
MAKGSREERLQIMLTEPELTALDDFRFKTRMPSRAAAIRELLKRGLAAEGFGAALFGGRSADYGVMNQSPNQLQAAELAALGGGAKASRTK